MSYQNRIEKLILQAYQKGQFHIITEISLQESLDEEVAIDLYHQELRAQGFQVDYDEVFRALHIYLPKVSFAERVRRVAYDESAMFNTWVKDISESIQEAAEYGKHTKRVPLRHLAIEGLEQKLADHFREEGFEVEVREYDDSYDLYISWKFKNVGE